MINEPVLIVEAHRTAVPKTCYRCGAVPTKFYKGLYSSTKYAACEKHKLKKVIGA